MKKIVVAVALAALVSGAVVAGERSTASKTTPRSSSSMVGTSQSRDSTSARLQSDAVQSPDAGGGSFANNSKQTMVEKYQGKPDNNNQVANESIFDEGYLTARVVMDWKGTYSDATYPDSIHVYRKACDISQSLNSSYRVYGMLSLKNEGETLTRASATVEFQNQAQNFRFVANDGSHGDKLGIAYPDGSWINNRKPLEVVTNVPVLPGMHISFETRAKMYIGCNGSTYDLPAYDMRWRWDDGDRLTLPAYDKVQDGNYQATIEYSIRKDNTARAAATCAAFSKSYSNDQCKVSVGSDIYGTWVNPTSTVSYDADNNKNCSAAYRCTYKGSSNTSTWDTLSENAVIKPKPGYCQRFPDECTNGIPK